APSRQSVHNWTDVANRIGGLGDGAIVYRESTGPYEAKVSNGRVDYDRVGANLEARYKNIQIRIAYKDAAFDAKSGQVKVTHVPYSQVGKDLEKIAKNLVEHL